MTGERPAESTLEAAHVVRDDERQQFELRLGEALIGRADFHASGDVVEVPHVKIRDDLRGQGYGSALAVGLLDDIRASHQRVDPQCPFLDRYIRDHATYHDLVD